ncbi:MAG: VCBS repeat-containing protein [Candidatus Eisenbacteria bacterium]|uniref:VCBS repeat-containing protein n=1 Tax=Eiseniibacteriota bacterium TaxID=2212470 RepID=A0A956SDP4_UNCEI|nr:VCBS repeat-containing protein [Candidatus Eisenbacteria bacterium]
MRTPTGDRPSRLGSQLLATVAGISPLLLLASAASGQWTTQAPMPTFLDVRGVGAPGADHVFLATDDDSFDDGGALFESTDGGATWVQRDVPFSLASPLYGLFFLDSLHGWAYGNENYRTTDGGATWEALPVLGSTYRMEFHTATFGIASGNSWALVSYDSGTTWEAQPDDIRFCDFADPLLGLGVAPTGIFRTTDGGANFSFVTGGAVVKDAAFLSGTTAVGIVDDTFVRSTDGGATWTTGGAAEGRTRIEALSANVVLAWGRGGTFPNYDDRVFRSTDGGTSWSDLGEIMSEGVWAFANVDGQTVVACDNRGNMFQSTDEGESWAETFASPGPFPGFLSSATPQFANALTGYFGYGPGFAIKTTDGGASWTQISSGSGQSLNDIDRFPDGTLIAVGEEGTVLRSDGASAWLPTPQFTTTHLTAVDVVGANEVVVTTENGLVYRSADGGDSWTAAGSTPTGLGATDLDFTTLQDGWLIGFGFSSGALFHTTDGGDSWTSVPDFAGGYEAVDFEGASGWAANVGGILYRTTDDGTTWTEETLPGSPFQIYDMDFWDVSIGYAVGGGGYAARSDDGGMNWEVLPTPNSSDRFTDIYLLGPNELWLSTTDDRAYYTATGGQNWALLEIGSNGFGSFSAIAASPEGDAWTVGFQGYVEQFQGPPPPPLNRPPEASFDFDTNGLSVDLTDTSTDPDGFIIGWEWDFGDGTGSTEQNPSHTFEVENTYIVRLTVTDDDGDTGSAVRFIVVQPNPGGVFGDFTEVTPLDPLFVTPQNEDFWVSTTAPADFDGDDDLDIAVFGYYVVYNQSVEERLVLIRNDGQLSQSEWEFSYIDLPLDELYAGASDMVWGDVDNDGDEDLIVGSFGKAVLYRNDEGTLVITDTVLPGYYEDNDQADFDLRSMSFADFDNDGDLDLLMPSVWDTELFEYRTVLLRNDGENGTGGIVFSEVDAGFASTFHAQSAWADFDGDQDLDLLLVHVAPLTNEGFIRRYRNDGDGGVFVGEDILGALTIEHGEAQWGDYDDDGDFDILVAGHIKELDGSFTQTLRIYRNDDETYVPIEVIECVPCDGWFDITAATWADYDSDGDVDILMTGTYNSGSQIEGRARVYANDGGVFTDSGNDLPAPRAGGSRGGSFTWLDLDQDFDLDYFIAGEYFVPGGNGLIEAQMHAYRNDGPGQNQRPGAPGNLAAVVGQGGTVALTWDPATDDQTPSAALTYDLGLYRNGVPLSSPRRLPEPGNLSAASEWTLSGLPDGAYTWTLRAVDSSYNGGPTAEGAFHIGSTTDAPEGVLPTSFSVRNAPNPFRGATSFSYALPTESDVDLSIFDAQGRLVTQLARGMRPAGTHVTEWDARGIASGTYFARFRAGSFEQTSRVLLVK